jgi:hypothetical protein
MQNLFGRAILLTVALLSAAPIVYAGGNEDLAFFESKIRPVLAEHCYSCHSAKAKKPKGKLLLDTASGLRKGGESGPAIVPGEPDKSLLIRALRHTDPDLKMPPERKLPASVIADLETWVKRGAPDPRKEPAPAIADASWAAVFNERRQWWSLQPVRKPSVPSVKNTAWSSQAIDRFILARLEGAGLMPAGDADPRTLLRRLSLVLTGLPPSAAEAEGFANAWNAAGAKRQAVVEAAVDRLLASPHFGERWARHWMDVVRFTETHGNEWNYEVHHAWRYRDYLIRAFNDDVPFDQLVREHIAGDLLAKPRCDARENFNESVIGTAFYRFGEVNHDDCIDLRQIGYDILDNQIDTLTKAFQATTIACARCHDHKLDAVSMRDYYGLLGILRSSRCVSHTIDSPEVNVLIQRSMRNTKAEIRHELAALWLSDTEPARIAKALAAVTNDKLPPDNPLAVWRQITSTKPADNAVADAIKKAADDFAREDRDRRKFNADGFAVLADFREGAWPNWQVGGQGLRDTPSRSGDFTIPADGALAISAILPAGAYTHAISEKLNGTLRSPVLTAGKKHISFQVLGEHASAVRLVSNNCQLNYRNFRYLHNNRLHWITFPLPADADGLRVYAELMTKFDNPKFPDQLGQLGGDKKDYRMPWKQAAADPRSHFGITHVVLHDQPAPPRPSLAHLRCLFDGPAPKTLAELASRYASRLQAAIRYWSQDKATDDDALWLDAFVQGGLLNNRADATPRLAEHIASYRRLEAKLGMPRVIPGLADCGTGFEQSLFIRGDFMKPGEKTPRRFAEVLAPNPIVSAGSGRLELANLIAAPDNPLTARVMVNRVWHHLFGTGLVRTVDDFGHVGERPSHPELLDYMADQFVRDGWSLKRLIRSIVITRTFQLAHEPSPAHLAVDPDNRLLGHYPARRMEAEAIRDALLATSDRLDRTLFGPSIAAYREKEYADRRLFRGPLDGAGRRSIYIKVTLMEPPKFLEVFNFPGGKVTQGRRDVTDTPAQALAMLNDAFVVQQAEEWCKHLIERKSDTVESRITAMFGAALGRPPRPAEAARFARFVGQRAEAGGTPSRDTLSNAAVWRDVAHAVFNMREFITIP